MYEDGKMQCEVVEDIAALQSKTVMRRSRALHEVDHLPSPGSEAPQSPGLRKPVVHLYDSGEASQWLPWALAASSRGL